MMNISSQNAMSLNMAIVLKQGVSTGCAGGKMGQKGRILHQVKIRFNGLVQITVQDSSEFRAGTSNVAHDCLLFSGSHD
jgi:hypothetical protein